MNGFRIGIPRGFRVSRRRLAFHFSVLVCLTLAATTAAQAVGPLELLPPDADFVGSVNVKAVLKSPAMLKVLLARPALAAKLASPLGIGLVSAISDYENAFVAVDVDGREAVIAIQTVKPVDVEGFVKDFSDVPFANLKQETVGQYTLYAAEDGRAVTRLDEKWLVAGTAKTLREVLAKPGKNKLPLALNQITTGTKLLEVPAVFAARFDGLAPKLANSPAMPIPPEMLRMFKSMICTATIAEKATLRFRMLTANPATAQQAAGMMFFVLPLMSQNPIIPPTLRSLLGQVRTTVEGNYLNVWLDMTPDQLGQLIEELLPLVESLMAKSTQTTKAAP
jgi:hypothetical protein